VLQQRAQAPSSGRVIEG